MKSSRAGWLCAGPAESTAWQQHANIPTLQPSPSTPRLPTDASSLPDELASPLPTRIRQQMAASRSLQRVAILSRLEGSA